MMDENWIGRWINCGWMDGWMIDKIDVDNVKIGF